MWKFACILLLFLLKPISEDINLMRIKEINNYTEGYGTFITFQEDGGYWLTAETGKMEIWKKGLHLKSVPLANYIKGTLYWDNNKVCSGYFSYDIDKDELEYSPSLVENILLASDINIAFSQNFEISNSLKIPGKEALAVSLTYRPSRKESPSADPEFKELLALVHIPQMKVKSILYKDAFIPGALLDASSGYIVTGTDKVDIWEIDSGRKVNTIDEPLINIEKAFLLGDRLIVFTVEGQNFKFDIKSGVVSDFAKGVREVTEAKIIHGTSLIAGLSRNNHLYILSDTDGKVVFSKSYKEPLEGISISPDNHLFLSIGGKNPCIKVYSIEQ